MATPGEILLVTSSYTLAGAAWLLDHLAGLSADHLTQVGTRLRVYDASDVLLYEIPEYSPHPEHVPIYAWDLTMGSCTLTFQFPLDAESFLWRRVEIVSPAGVIIWDAALAEDVSHVAGRPDLVLVEMRLLTAGGILPEGAEHWWRLVTGESADHLDANAVLRVYETEGDPPGSAPSLGQLSATTVAVSATAEMEWYWMAGHGILTGIWGYYAVETVGGVGIYFGPLDVPIDKSSTYGAVEFYHRTTVS